MEIANIKVEQAKAHLSHLGYGTATNFTVQNVSVLMVSYANHQSTSQKETIERLRRELSHLIKALETVHSFGATKPIIEGAEQVLKETEPIDQ